MNSDEFVDPSCLRSESLGHVRNAGFRAFSLPTLLQDTLFYSIIYFFLAKLQVDTHTKCPVTVTGYKSYIVSLLM